MGEACYIQISPSAKFSKVFNPHVVKKMSVKAANDFYRYYAFFYCDLMALENAYKSNLDSF